MQELIGQFKRLFESEESSYIKAHIDPLLEKLKRFPRTDLQDATLKWLHNAEQKQLVSDPIFKQNLETVVEFLSKWAQMEELNLKTPFSRAEFQQFFHGINREFKIIDLPFNDYQTELKFHHREIKEKLNSFYHKFMAIKRVVEDSSFGETSCRFVIDTFIQYPSLPFSLSHNPTKRRNEICNFLEQLINCNSVSLKIIPKSIACLIKYENSCSKSTYELIVKNLHAIHKIEEIWKRIYAQVQQDRQTKKFNKQKILSICDESSQLQIEDISAKSPTERDPSIRHSSSVETSTSDSEEDASSVHELFSTQEWEARRFLNQQANLLYVMKSNLSYVELIANSKRTEESKAKKIEKICRKRTTMGLIKDLGPPDPDVEVKIAKTLDGRPVKRQYSVNTEEEGRVLEKLFFPPRTPTH